MLGRFDEARVDSIAAGEQMRGLGRHDAEWSWQLAYIATLAGDHESAAVSMRSFCDFLEARGNLALLSTYAPMLGRSLCALGRYDEAEPLARRGCELGAADDIITQALWRQVQARVLAHRGESTEAERLARDAVAILEQTEALNGQGDALCDLAEVLEKGGKRDEASAAWGEALDRYERKRNYAAAAQLRRRVGMTSLPAADMEPSEGVSST
jgi:tetratricopeptide (TPR) repeat protein